MKRYGIGIALLGVVLGEVLGLVLVALLSAGAASAQAPEDRIPAEKILEIDKTRKFMRGLREYQVGPRVSRYAEAALQKYEASENEEGRALLERLNVNRMNPMERAQIYQLRAYLEYGAGNYDAAVENFEKALEQQILSVKAEDSIRFGIAQLHAAQQQWKEVIPALERWFKWQQDPDPLAYYLLAIANYQLENFDEAKHWGEVAVDASPEPKEGWLQLLAALYVREQDYASAQPIFEELVTRFPKKDYWVQLSLIYGARDDYEASLSVQQIAYQQGLLTEDKELQRLARSYLFTNLPYPAARVLEKGLAEGKIEPTSEVYELLANSWIAAREYQKAREPLVRAAELSEGGRLYVRLAQVNMQNEEWGEAAKLIETALEKGGFDDKQRASAHLLLGICYYNDQRVDPAKSAFQVARRHEALREQADAWIAHIVRETQSG